MHQSSNVTSDYRKYLIRYNHDGASWCLEIDARSPDDARARVAKLAFATYEGELVAKVPAYAGGPARVAVVARNLIRSILGV